MGAQKLKLVPGQFYLSKAKQVWCCYRVDPNNTVHCQAFCVRVNDGRIEYFYLDGRYDSEGKREHTLVKKYVKPTPTQGKL